MHSKVKKIIFIIFENLCTNVIHKTGDQLKIGLNVDVKFTVSVLTFMSQTHR
jgi:hypothetical protein